MSAIQIIREQAIGFDAQGQSVVTDQYFIKLQVGFLRFARQFKDARLYFFLEVAFQEAYIHLNGAQPLTIPDVCERWEISRRSCSDAVKYLLEHNFIVNAGVRPFGDEHRSAYMYRPSAFAWFGAGLLPPTDSGSPLLPAQDSRAGVQNLHTYPAVQNTALPVQNETAGMQNAAQKVCKTPRRGVQKPTRGMQNAPNHIVDDIGTNSFRETNKKQQARKPKISKTLAPDENEQKARAYFRSFGIGGVNLGKLAKLVSPEIAEEWALYARHTDKTKEMVQGICYNSLISDPMAPPPCSPHDLDDWRLDEIRAIAQKTAQTEYERKLAAGEIEVEVKDEPLPYRTDISTLPTYPADPKAAQLWQQALGELQLQMTKATYDTWVKPTFAISFDDERAQLVIGVRTAYAKQWLENRLAGMIARTVQHCAGKPVDIQFFLKTQEDFAEVSQ